MAKKRSASGKAKPGPTFPTKGKIDPAKVPKRVLLDTGVLIRALEGRRAEHRKDPRTAGCRELWEFLLRRNDGRVLIAAPSFFEFGAKKGHRPPPFPTTIAVVIVPFTEKVAEDMLAWCNVDMVREVRTQSKTDRVVVKFDSLIVACARAHKAGVIVSLDSDVKKLAKHAGVECSEPDDLRQEPEPQLDMWKD